MVPYRFFFALLMASMPLHNPNAAPATSLLPANFESSIEDYFVLRKYVWGEDRRVARIIIDAVDWPVEGKLASRKSELHILVVPDIGEPFEGKYEGITVLLVNNTEEPQCIPTQDYRIYMIQEAKDRKGKWRPIEALGMAGCNMSFFNVLLSPMTYWTFTAPRYQGSFETKLRFRLALSRGQTVYSKEFDGSVNDGQFEGGQFIDRESHKSLWDGQAQSLAESRPHAGIFD